MVKESFPSNDKLGEILRAFALGHIGDGLRLDDMGRKEFLDVCDFLSGHGTEIPFDEVGELYRLWDLEMVAHYFRGNVCAGERGGVDRIERKPEILDVDGEILCLADSHFRKRKIAMAIEYAVYVVFILTVADEVDVEHELFSESILEVLSESFAFFILCASLRDLLPFLGA